MKRTIACVAWIVAFIALATVANLSSPTPAAAQTPNGGSEFVWQDGNMRTGFENCLNGVDGTVADAAGFDDQPRCEQFLPNGYYAMVPDRFWSEPFKRCVGNTQDNKHDRRPDPVPAWYWHHSMRSGHCYLLLPRGAFDLGNGSQDSNAWTAWTPDREVDYPDTHENKQVIEAYNLCNAFIDARLRGELGDGLGTFGGPPEGSVSELQWHQALNYYVAPSATAGVISGLKTVPGSWFPNCERLFVADGSSPDPAGVPSPDGGDEFVWQDGNMRAGFEGCLNVVEDTAKSDSSNYGVPPNVDKGLWDRAVDYDYLLLWSFQEFDYRPHCELFLPNGYERLVPSRFWSEPFKRCLENVKANQHVHRRPDLVPGWYWYQSLRSGHCYLLLPRGAFGLGNGSQDSNAWSAWTPDREVVYPTSHENKQVMEAYRVCIKFIEARLNGELPAGMGTRFAEPPSGSVSKLLWHQALNYYVEASDTDSVLESDTTVPDNWFPTCERLLEVRPCDRTADLEKAIIPELCVGPHATSQYDIGYSEYKDVDEKGDTSFGRFLWGALTGFTYFLGKEAVHLSLWLVDWGYSFEIDDLNLLAINVGNKYQNNLVLNPLGARVRDLFWLVLFAWAGYTALRGRLAAAGSEILVTIVMLLLAGVLISNREVYMNATWELMNKASATLLAAGMNEPGDAATKSTDEMIKEVQGDIHKVFVEDSYDLINWGQPLGEPGDPDNPLAKCAGLRHVILDRGPHAEDRYPRELMTRIPECAPLAEFNRNPSGNRLMGAILMLVSSLAMAILVGMMALTIVVGKLIALLLFGVVPLGAVIAILPGGGRKLAWTMVFTLGQVVVVVVGMGGVLSVLLLSVREVTTLPGPMPLIQRFLLLNIFIFIFFIARRSLLTGGQRLAARLTEFLSATKGSGTTWATAGAASAGQGLNLLSVDRAAFWAGVAPTAAAGRGVQKRLVERRVARRGARNMRNTLLWKRATNSTSARWRDRHGYPLHRAHVAPVRRQPLP